MGGGRGGGVRKLCRGMKEGCVWEKNRVISTGKEPDMIDTAGAQPRATWVERTTQIRITLGEFCLANVGFRAMTLPGFDWRYPIDITDQLIQSLLQSPVEAVYLSSFPTSGRLPRLSFRKYWFRYVPWQAGRHYIDLDGTFQQYLGRFSAKSRNTLARGARKFAEASGGAVDFREYRHPDDMSAFHEAASQVTRKTFQHKLLKSGLPLTDDFRGKLFELAALDKFRGYILFHGKSPVAFMYCTAHNDVLTGQVAGYDPAFQQYSPGTLLLYHILNRVFSEGRFRVFDFGIGESSYKDFFGTGVASCAAVYHFAYTPKNVAFLGAHLATWFVSAAVVKILSVLRIKDFVKKAIRRAS